MAQGKKGTAVSNAERQRQHRIKEQQRRELLNYVANEVERIEAWVKAAANAGDADAKALVDAKPQNIIGAIKEFWMLRACDAEAKHKAAKKVRDVTRNGDQGKTKGTVSKKSK
jgi:hypothetical protein